MPMHIRTGGAWQAVTNPELRVGGAWQPIENAWVMVGGTWRKFYQRTPLVENVNATVDSAPCDGGGQFTVTWDASPPDQVAVATFDVEIEVTDAAFGTHGQTFNGVSSGDPLNFSLCPDSTGTVTVYMKIGGVTVAQDDGAI